MISFRGRLLETIRKRSVLSPTLLLCGIFLISSTNCLHTFSLLFVSDFTATQVNGILMLVVSSAKMGSAVVAVILGRRIGLKMLLLLGQLCLVS